MVKEASPVIVDKNGKFNYVDVFNGYYYIDVYVFDKFFFCDINDIELRKVSAKEGCVQFSNDGKILHQAINLKIPDGKVLWTSDSTFINRNLSSITRGSILNDPDWVYPVNISKHENCDMKISMEGDDMHAIYYLSSWEKKDTLTYKLSYRTGKEVVKVKGILVYPKEKGLIIGEKFALTPILYPDNASVKDVTWKSSNESIATINELGKGKAISKGKCTITAITKDGNFEATSKINVTSEYEVNGIYFPEPIVKIIIDSIYKLKTVVTSFTGLNKNIK